MAKSYGDIPCVKLGSVIHITLSGNWCACGRKYAYGRPSRSEHKCVNIIWREIDAVTCPICKKRWENDPGVTPLTPSFHGKDCLGNGEHIGIECCCDECDHYLTCFPDWKEHTN